MTESSQLASASSDHAPINDARKRQLMLLGGLAVVVIVVLAYVLLTRGGSSKDGATQQTIPPARSTASAPTSASPDASLPVVVPAVYQGPLNRSPFKPLVTPPLAASVAAPAPSASPTPTPRPSTIVAPSVVPIISSAPSAPTATITVTATPSPTGSATISPTPSPSPTGLPTAGQAITLSLDSVDASAGTADVTVTQGATSTPYTGIKPGQVFGQYFKLVSILSSDPNSPPVAYGADFEYGDQFVQLAEGDTAQLG